MNLYYNQLAKVVYDDFAISPYQAFRFRNYYLTVDDYLLGVSRSDPLKNILSLIKTLPDDQEVLRFIHSAIARIIQEIIFENPEYLVIYQQRIKSIQ